LRSLLFVPGDDERKLAKAASADADALILDLEDSVASVNKAKARALVAAFLSKSPAPGARPRLYVRVNGLASGMVAADIAGFMSGAPDGVMLPKSLGGASVQELGARLAVQEAEHNLPDGATKILAIATESAVALFGMASYRNCSQRLEGLAWGAEDLSADLGAERRRDAEGRFTDAMRLARTMTLVGAVAAGVTPIDAIYSNFRDIEGLARECDDARADGFQAKMAIHPAQVPRINAAFTPSHAAVARARAIVAAFAAEEGAGVVSLDGEMLDKPHLEQAKRLLARSAPDGARE
jgi:citrate lyase subunit beta / citryl-CoA lyase